MRALMRADRTPLSISRAKCALAAMGLALPALIPSACTPSSDRPADASPNIVLVSIDSLRADHVGAYGYPKPTTPFLDRLAREGVLFENAISNSAWTLPAHSTLFTGLLESAHAVRTPRSRLGESYVTLAERLSRAGYRTHGFYSGPFLHPAYGLAQGFDSYEDCTSYGSADYQPQKMHQASHRDVTNPIVRRKVAQAIAELSDRPFFFFIHMWDVHYDLIPPERYKQMFDSDYAGSFDGRDFRHETAFKPGIAAADFSHVMALYDGEIRFTDDTLSAIFDTLVDAGHVDNTVVVVVSDHGEEFLEHGSKGHRHALYQEVIRIPMVVWMPSRFPARRSATTATLADIAPTLLELAGVERMNPTTGSSLVSILQGTDSNDRVAVAELTAPPRAPDLSAVLSGKHKIVVDPDRATYYDLAVDPGEKRPVPASSTAEGRKLVAELRRAKRAASQIAAAHGATDDLHLGDDMKRRLEKLGYLD
jgi:arylsulfatase A-like enzyme